MNTIYIIRPIFCFPLVPNTATILTPDNYDEIASVVLSCSGKTNINAHPDLMFDIKTYFHFQPHRSLTTFWNDAIDEVKKKN